MFDIHSSMQNEISAQKVQWDIPLQALGEHLQFLVFFFYTCCKFPVKKTLQKGNRNRSVQTTGSFIWLPILFAVLVMFVPFLIFLSFPQNLTAIVDPDHRICYIMALNRTQIAPPRDLIDLIVKLKVCLRLNQRETSRSLQCLKWQWKLREAAAFSHTTATGFRSFWKCSLLWWWSISLLSLCHRHFFEMSYYALMHACTLTYRQVPG